MKTARPPLKRILTRQYVLLACVPLLLVVVLWSAVVIPQTLRDIEQENQRTALLIRAQVDLLISVPREAAARAATHVRPGADEPEMRAALSEALDEAQTLESAVLLDTSGIVKIAEVRPGTRIGKEDWEGLDLTSRPFYERARLATAPIWSNTFLSPLTGHVTAVVAAPSDGRLVVADLSLAKMAQQIHASGSVGDAGNVAVIVFDGLGRLIVHPEQERADWQENIGQLDLVHRALNGYVGPGEIELDGKRWLATVAPLATTGWYVLVAQPRNVLFAPVKQLAGVVGIAVLMVLGIVVAIALKLAQRQAGNYRQLVSAAADLVDDTPRGGPEPGEPDVDLGSEEVYALWAQLRRLLDRAKDQERTARHAQAELQALLDAATEVAIIAVDADHVVRLFNRGAEKMLGYRAVDVLGAQCPLSVHDPIELARRAEELTYQLKRPVSGREAITAVAERFGYEVRDWTYVRKDGSRLSVSLAVTAVRASLASAGSPQGPVDRRGEGEVVFAPGSGVAPASDSLGFLFVGTDQSERLRSGELELARRRAEAASQAKSEFLSRVSHELRTPMNAMLGYAQLLQLEEDHPLDGHQRERVARIEAAGWHLVTLINDVLDLSTIESGNARIQMGDVDVGLVINESVRLLAPLAETAKVTLAVALPQHVPREAWAVQADATRLRQVFVNVIGNAIKYNLENGRVDIAVHVRAPAPDAGEGDPGSLVVEISDTGRGMTAAQLARLFSAFDRLGLETSPIEGTGIGLVISRRLIERMGGDIAIDSRSDVGTRVTLTLRRAHGVPALAPGDVPARGTLGSGAGGQIVYVEDNPINALLMQEVIEQRPDCRLHLAVSVRDGIDMIDRLRPDLVLVDLHLPDGSGLEVAEWMRTMPLLTRVPVVVVSADSTQTQRDAATVAGVRAYLAKPIRLTETLMLIDELLPVSR